MQRRGGARPRTVFPLTDAKLHLRFAGLQVPSTDNAIFFDRDGVVRVPSDFSDALQFAHEYGQLGVALVEIRFRGWPDPLLGESFASWAYEVRRLRELLRVWRSATGRDPVPLGGDARLSTPESGVVEAYWSERLTNLFMTGGAAGVRFPLRSVRRSSPGEPGGKAERLHRFALRRLVQREVAAVIEETCVPTLDFASNFGIGMRAKCLLGAIYLSFLREIVGAWRGPRLCIRCGTRLPPDSAPQRKFCNAICRGAAEKRRQRARKASPTPRRDDPDIDE